MPREMDTAQKVKHVGRLERNQAQKEFQTEMNEPVVREENPLNQINSSTRVTLNELRVHMGFGETRSPKVKVRNIGEEMKRLFNTIPWYEYDVNAHAHMERVAKLSMKCMRGSLEYSRDERCIDLTVDPYTLQYGPTEAASVLNDNLAGIVAETRLYWMFGLSIVTVCLTAIPMPTDSMEYMLGGGWISWLVDGVPETNTVWLLATRIAIFAFLPALCWVRFTVWGRRFIGPLSELMSVFCHGVALASALMFPCGPAPAIFLIIASYVSVAVWMSWLRILAIQGVHLTVLTLFATVGSFQPQDVCSYTVLPSSGGATGAPLSVSSSEKMSHEYLKTILLILCNFPFVFHFTRSRRMQFLYQIRDLLLWEQYKFVIASDLDQKDSELNRVRECLHNATDALTEERKASQVEVNAETTSLLDLCRDKHGCVAPVLYQKYLYTLPDWHRTKIHCLLVTFRLAEKYGNVEKVARTPVIMHQILATLTEVNVGVTLQQALLKIANVT